MSVRSWPPSNHQIKTIIEEKHNHVIQNYREDPHLLQEHINLEKSVQSGGYQNRFLYELIQNGADAALASNRKEGHQIHIHLASDGLYIANTGEYITKDGVLSLLYSNTSTKNADQIGRFGLGFKSILNFPFQSKPHVKILSRSASFEFYHEKLKKVYSQFSELPVLRLAWNLNSLDEFRLNPILQDFSLWADTIIYLSTPISAEQMKEFINKFKEFEKQFLLFLEIDLTLKFTTQEYQRIVQKKHAGDHRWEIIENNTQNENWYVFQKMIDIPSVIKKTALTQGRDSIPIIWAVQEKISQTSGKFWMFFPLTEECCVPGIWNAPWHMNTERTTLNPSEYNNYIIKQMSQLFFESINIFIDRYQSEDYGEFLDFFPRETGGNVQFSGELRKTIEQHLRSLKIPNVVHHRATCQSLKVHPELPHNLLQQWEQYVSEIEQQKYIHPDLQKNRDRFARIRNLIFKEKNYSKDDIIPILTWLPPIKDITSCSFFWKMLMEFNKNRSWKQLKQELQNRNLSLIINTQQQCVSIHSDNLYLTSVLQDSLMTVHPDLLSDPALKVFLQEEYFLKDYNHTPEEQLICYLEQDQHEQFWTYIKSLEMANKHEFLQKNIGKIKLKTLNQQWQYSFHMINYGSLVKYHEEIDSENKKYLIDIQFHEKYQYLLKLILRDVPLLHEKSVSKNEFLENNAVVWHSQAKYEDKMLHFIKNYYDVIIHHFSVDHRKANKLRRQYISLNESMYDHNKSTDDENLWLDMHFSSTINLILDSFLSTKITSWLWRTKVQFTQIQISYETQQNENTNQVSSQIFLSSVLMLLIKYGKIMIGSRKISMDNLFALMREDYDLISKITKDMDLFKKMKKMTIDRNQSFKLQDIKVENRTYLFKEARYQSEDYLRFDLPSAEKLIWESLGSLIATCSVEIQSEYYKKIFIKKLDLPIPWSNIHLVTSTEEIQSYHQQNQMAMLLTKDQITEIRVKNQIENENNNEQTSFEDAYFEDIRTLPDLADKLLQMLEDPRPNLLQQLPLALQKLIQQQNYDDVKIAKIFMAYYGYQSLEQIQYLIKKSPCRVPKSWKGGREEREFVQYLGFPDAFAGMSGRAKKAPWETVVAPFRLKKLHKYQQEVYEQAAQFIHTNTHERRCLISLPTGSGKTRIAVEIAIQEGFKQWQNSDGNNIILWIAQQKELCEQALVSFVQSWPWLAEPGQELRVSRLFEGRKAEFFQGSQVLIATIQTLIQMKETPWWLEHVKMIVIDEAHRAITSSYKDLLNWFEKYRNFQEIPMIGLSATPFRRREEDAQKLVKMFINLIPRPEQQENLYRELKEKQFLAKAYYRVISYEKSVVFNQEDIADIVKFNEIPRKVLDRMGEDSTRNDMLVQFILKNRTKSILVFASSVSGAQMIASQLAIYDVASACVSGNTDQKLRNYFIEEFKAQKIQVLTNCDLLTTGFDAPQIDMIVIARPTFSLNLYQQMVGRGLRGPKNGGKEICEIVTIEDNLGRFSEKLAFKHIKDLWEKESLEE